MIEGLFTVARQVGVLFSLMAVGFVCNKTKLLTESSIKGMVNVLILIVTPCLIVHSFEAQTFRPELLTGLGWAFAFSFLAPLLALGAAVMLSPKSEDVRTRSVLRCAVVFSNAGFMGIPLEHALLGAEGVFYGVAYVVVFNLMFWTWGLVTFCGSLRDVRLRTLFLNPGSIGVALGLPFFLFSLKLPVEVGEPVRMMSELNTPLAMIIIGYGLADARFAAALRNWKAYVASFLRLVAVPCVFLSLAFALHCAGLTFSSTMAIAITIAASAPCAAMTSMFAVRYDRDVSLSVGLVSSTTLLSILTMPPIIALAMWLFND